MVIDCLFLSPSEPPLTTALKYISKCKLAKTQIDKHPKCPSPYHFLHHPHSSQCYLLVFLLDDSIDFSVDVGKNLMGLDTEKGCFGKLEFTPKFSQGDLL